MLLKEKLIRFYMFNSRFQVRPEEGPFKGIALRAVAEKVLEKKFIKREVKAALDEGLIEWHQSLLDGPSWRNCYVLTVDIPKQYTIKGKVRLLWKRYKDWRSR